MATKEEKKEAKAQEDWMTKKWRPMMAMMYMTCCLFDFALFPIMFTVVQFWEVQAANDAFRQWVPITLQGGGLFHVAMGAVLGVSAYGRTQEKVAGASTVGTGIGTPTPQLGMSTPSQFGSPQPSSFGSREPSFGGSSFGGVQNVQNYSAPQTMGSSMGMGAPSRPMGEKAARFAEADPDSVLFRG